MHPCSKPIVYMLCATAAVIALSLTVVRAAHAQSASAVDESDFDAVYERGRAHAKAGRWKAALRDYRRAYQLRRHTASWTVIGNYANAAEKVGHLVEAARMFRETELRLPASDPDYALYKAKLAKRRGALDERVGTVMVEVSPAGAEVALDDQPLGKAPLAWPAYAMPGAHSVTVQLDGYAPQRHTVMVTAGHTAPLTLTLVAVADEAQRAHAELQQAADGGDDAPSWPGWMALGVGATGVAVGAVLLGRAANADDDVTTLQAQVDTFGGDNVGSPGEVSVAGCDDLLDAAERHARLRASGITSLVLAGAVATGGVIWLLTAGDDNDSGDSRDSRDSEPQTALTFAPRLAPGHFGLQLGGTF